MSQSRHVLYLSYDGMTDPLGQSQVLPYLLGLCEKGYIIHLVSFEKPEYFKLQASNIKEVLIGKSINWYPQNYTKRPPIISTLIDISKMRKVATRIIRSNQPDLIHARSYISGIVANSLSKKYDLPYLFDMRGFWADERVDGNIWNLKNPLYRIIYQYFKQKEKVLIKNSDGIISLTENAKQEIRSWNIISNADEKITVIPCCCDIELFDPEKFETNREYDKIKGLVKASDGPVFVYLGAIGTWYLLSEMLAFFKYILNTHPRSTFLFITREPSKLILSTAKEYNIPQGRLIITAAERKYIPSLLSLANYGIFFIKPSYSKKASSPTKQGELMAMGIPVFSNSGVGDTDLVINKYHSGVLVDPLDDSGFTAAISQLEDVNKLDHQKIREGAIDFFSLKKGIDNYKAVYEKLIIN